MRIFGISFKDLGPNYKLKNKNVLLLKMERSGWIYSYNRAFEAQRWWPACLQTVLKKHTVDLGGRLFFPAGAFWCQAWRTPLHHPTIFPPDHADRRIRHRGLCDELPAERRRRRDAANSDETQETNARLWCLPGCRRPTGEEALNSFNLDDDDYDAFETWF